ncbi:16S rRNA (guanine(527)-N(7))-methyltransferase [Salvia divinorum]|uniref:16S rRNA (Guanine(527)-N(7))-methyltransferase n=1 Tax=Salvia divinorum TaxID=28513 RepID=A0ABD1IBY7_SALDI
MSLASSACRMFKLYSIELRVIYRCLSVSFCWREAEYCLPFVRVGGFFVAAKGHDPQEVVAKAERAIHLMGASLLQSCFASYSRALPPVPLLVIVSIDQ